MKPYWMALLAMAAAVSPVRGGLVTGFEFEGEPGPRSEHLYDAGKIFFTRLRENKSSGQAARLAADTPEVLAGRSRTCVEINRGLVWLKPFKGGEFTFAPAFSVNFWFKAEAAPEKLAFLLTFNKSWRLGYQPSNRRFYFQNLAGGEKEYSAVLPFPSGVWQMLTVTFDRGKLNFYCGGKPIGSRELKKQIAPSPELFLGNGAAFDRSWFDGKIDELGIFDHALSPAEIRELLGGKPLGRGRAPRVARRPGVLERIVTSPLPPDFKAFEPVREIAAVRDGRPAAVIVRADTGDLAGLETEVQRRFQEKWGVEFPLMPADEALKSGRPLILFGRSNSNMPLRRLDGNGQISHAVRGTEVRVLPMALDWAAGAVVLGGATREAVLRGVDRLTEKFPDPARLTFWIDTDFSRQHRVDPAATAAMVEAMREHYRNPPDYIPNQSAIRVFRPAVDLFRQTGAPEYARAYAEMLKIYQQEYAGAVNDRKTPPSFTLHEFPWQWSLMENSPAFSAEDRVRAAEIARRCIEDCMDYWEMRDPMANYEAGKQVYYTNHPIFASRSVYFAAEYLWRHYRYEPARYWLAVAVNALEGIAPHPIGPEDSASYQYICYRLFVTYALASGRYGVDFFNSDRFREYIRYAKANYHHLGATTGYGDNPPLHNAGSFPVLGYAVDLFGDDEAESLLALIARRTANPTYRKMILALGVDPDRTPAMSGDLNGLVWFPLDDFRLRQRNAPNYSRPVLDKAFFRSGWDPAADFLAVSGNSGAPHGHFDVNAIPAYVRGEHLWLVEGDYIRKQPEEHNTVTFRIDGRHVRPSPRQRAALGQVVYAGMTPAKRLAAIGTLAESYGKVDWTRNLAWEAGGGFWVIDEITAREAGEVLAENRWRLLGEIGPRTGQSQLFRQRSSAVTGDPATFAISEGSGAGVGLASQFDAGHRGREGYYAGYAYAGPEVRVLTQRHRRAMRPGETVRFVNYLGAEPVEIRRLAERAWSAVGGDGVRLAVFGTLQLPGMTVRAERCFIGPAGVVGFGVKELKIGDFAPVIPASGEIRLDREALPAAAAEVLTAAATGGERLEPAAADAVEAPQLALRRQTLPAVGTALAAIPGGGWLVGLERGGAEVRNADGTLLRTLPADHPVSTVAAVADRGGRVFFAVAVREPAGIGRLKLFDVSGKMLWEKELGIFQQRSGTIRVLFPAVLSPGAEPALIVGNAGWHYRAYALDGRELWKRQVYHGATAGTAADLNGDGADEIVAGAEYYYHQLLGPDGKVLVQRNGEPWNYAVAAVDLDGDGKLDALCGRSDSRIHPFMPPGGSALALEPLNIGGIPVGIVPFAAPGGVKFAAAAANGRVVLADGGFRIVHTVDLPPPVSGLCAAGDELYATAGDGRLYRLDGQGAVTGRGELAVDPNWLALPPPAANGRSLAVVRGRSLWVK